MPTERDRPSSRRRRLAVYAGLICAAICAQTLAAEKPHRIVSMNVCTDQLLLSLVSRDRIASLSHLAVDPYSSWIGEGAEGIHLNHGIAEEIIALDPDLVVTVSFSFRPTVTILKRLGYSVTEIRMASSLSDISTNLSVLGESVEEMTRANELNAAFRREIEQLTFRGAGQRPLFVSYEADGWTTGRDSLVADIAHIAGFETAGDRLDFSSGRQVSLEQLLLLNPELMDLGHAWDQPPALVSQNLQHPALNALLQTTPLIDIPDPLWMCGSLRTLEALAQLRRARERL